MTLMRHKKFMRLKIEFVEVFVFLLFRLFAVHEEEFGRNRRINLKEKIYDPMIVWRGGFCSIF